MNWDYLLIKPPPENIHDVLPNKFNIKNFNIDEYKNRHEYHGIKYLLSIGYDIKNIRLNNYMTDRCIDR